MEKKLPGEEFEDFIRFIMNHKFDFKKKKVKKRVPKLATRKDIRERLSEEEARDLFIKVRTKNTNNEIEFELRKIYDSSLDSLSDEDSRGILIFDESLTSW